MEAKVVEMSYAISGLASSHPNKQGKFSFQSLKLTSKGLLLQLFPREKKLSCHFLIVIKIKAHSFF